MVYFVFTEQQLHDALTEYLARKYPELVKGNHAYSEAAIVGNGIKDFLIHSPEAKAHKMRAEDKSRG